MKFKVIFFGNEALKIFYSTFFNLCLHILLITFFQILIARETDLLYQT